MRLAVLPDIFQIEALGQVRATRPGVQVRDGAPDGLTVIVGEEVKTTAGVGGYYRFKVWKASETEPATWLMTTQQSMTDPQYGSVLIVAHHSTAC